MSAKSFEIGNLADDLVFVTLEICGKAEDKNPRFPRLFYPTFVERIIKDALDIHEKVFEANERFRMKFYGRHMDDLYILSDSRETLAEILLWTTNYFDRIGLKLNPKTAITFRSFEYLGFGFTVGDTGKIIVRVAKSKLKSKRRHIKKMAEQLGAGMISPERFETMYFGWRAHASKAKNARTQILNMDRYANNVLNQAGHRLEIVKHKKGRVKWRVKITKKE